MEVGLVFAWFECLNQEFACMMRGPFLCPCMSLYKDCLLAVSLEMRGLFLFWSSHDYVCMVSSLYLPSLKFVLCMAMFA